MTVKIDAVVASLPPTRKEYMRQRNENVAKHYDRVTLRIIVTRPNEPIRRPTRTQQCYMHVRPRKHYRGPR